METTISTVLTALGDVATFRVHEDKTLLAGAESFLEDVELSKGDHEMLIDLRKHIDKLLSTPTDAAKDLREYLCDSVGWKLVEQPIALD